MRGAQAFERPRGAAPEGLDGMAELRPPVMFPREGQEEQSRCFLARLF
jgi:hypothetical protein